MIWSQEIGPHLILDQIPCYLESAIRLVMTRPSYATDSKFYRVLMRLCKLDKHLSPWRPNDLEDGHMEEFVVLGRRG
jgi:hypothetical protein